MRVINKTAWKTAHLHAILQRCAEIEIEDSAKRKRLVVEVVYSRRGGSSGYAYLRGTRSRVRIPSPTATTSEVKWVRLTPEDIERDGDDSSYELDDPRHWQEVRTRNVDGQVVTERAVGRIRKKLTLDMTRVKREFAKVALHEFAHNRGMSHRQMFGQYRWKGNWQEQVAWVDAMPLEPQAEKKRPASDERLEQRRTHVLAMLEKAKTRYKRARTILAKWQKKAKYYERKIAAQGKNADE